MSQAAIALEPTGVSAAQSQVIAHVARGDRRAIEAAKARGIPAPVIAANFSGLYEMSWVLEAGSRAI